MRVRSVFLAFAAIFSLSLISSTTNTHFFDNPKGTHSGIYHHFKDYKNNAPSMDLEYNIVATPFYHGFLKNRKVDYFQLEVFQKSHKREMRSIFGFRDRYYFYINPNYPKRLPKYRHFIRVEDFGQYWYYKTLPDNYLSQATAVQSNMVEVLFDTETGDKIYLTNQKIEEIISDNEKLLAEFRADKKNRKKYNSYLRSYFYDKEGFID